MRKNKIKLSLIDDYCKIVTIENFFKNWFPLKFFDDNLSKQIQLTNQNLKNFYEKLFCELMLNDCSLILLCSQLKSNNQLFQISKKNNFENLHSFIKVTNEAQQQILSNLKEKLLKLKIYNKIIIDLKI